MSATMGLLRIEARRTVAPWLVLPLLGLTWYFISSARPIQLMSWAATSVRVRDTILFVGPFIGGAAAWMAGRERRRGADDLLATTPRPPWSRHLAGWLGTTLWGLLTYLIGGAFIVALAARHAVWGGPTVWPMLIGLLALPAHTAIGSALGSWLPGRLVAPLAAVALFFSQIAIGGGIVGSTQYPPNSRFDWVTYLSPLGRLDASVWYGVQPQLGPAQAVFLFGLIGTALTLFTLRGGEGPGLRLALLAATALMMGGVALIVRATPPGGQLAIVAQGNLRPDVAVAGLIPYEPACTADPLPVCVHPAYRPQLATYAAQLNRLAAPLLGLPDAPIRAEQRRSQILVMDDGILLFQPNWFGGARDPYFTEAIVSVLVLPGPAAGIPPANCPGDPSRRSCAGAQQVLARWIARQAGSPTDLSDGRIAPGTPQGRPDPTIAAATDRFAGLDPAARRAWLEAHYADLRAGRVRLEDLP